MQSELAQYLLIVNILKIHYCRKITMNISRRRPHVNPVTKNTTSNPGNDAIGFSIIGDRNCPRSPKDPKYEVIRPLSEVGTSSPTHN